MTGDGGGLGPEARALLEAARGGLGPDAATIKRMHGKVAAAAAAGGSAGALGGALAAKLGIVGVIAALAVSAALVTRREQAPARPRVEPRSMVLEPAAPVASAAEAGEIEMAPVAARPAHGARVGASPGAATASRATVATPSRPVSPAPAIAAPTTGAGTRRPSPAVAASATHERPAVAAAARSAAAAVATPADLAREVALVDRAMAALRRDAPREALAAVRAHARETAGVGQLAEDAAAIEIEALCRLGDPAVGRKLAAFDARFPSSAQRSRLTTRCP